MSAQLLGARGRRSSYAGEVGPLVQILMRHIHKPGTIQYASKKNAKLDRAQIMPFSEMLFELYELQNNLSYTQTSMDLALREVAERKSFCKRRPNNIQLFVENVSARIRTMCRHVAQGHTKQTAWVLQMLRIPAGTSAAPLLEVSDTDPEAGPQSVAEAAAEAVPGPDHEGQQQQHGDAVPGLEEQHHGQGTDSQLQEDPEQLPSHLEDQDPEQHHGQNLEDQDPEQQPGQLRDQDPEQHHGQHLEDQDPEQHHGQGLVETQVDSGVEADSESDDAFPCAQASSSGSKRKADSDDDSDEEPVKKKKLRADGECESSSDGEPVKNKKKLTADGECDSFSDGEPVKKQKLTADEQCDSSSDGEDHDQLDASKGDDIAAHASPVKPKVIGLKAKKPRKKGRKAHKKVRLSAVGSADRGPGAGARTDPAQAETQLMETQSAERGTSQAVGSKAVRFTTPEVQSASACVVPTVSILLSLSEPRGCFLFGSFKGPDQNKTKGAQVELCMTRLWSRRFA